MNIYVELAADEMNELCANDAVKSILPLIAAGKDNEYLCQVTVNMRSEGVDELCKKFDVKLPENDSSGQRRRS